MKYSYLDGSKLNFYEAEEATKEYKLNELNAIYNDTIKEMGLSDCKFTTRCQIPGKEHQYGASVEYTLNSMNLKFSDKLSCRGYNRFCTLWGEGKPGAVEEGGHKFNEDSEIAKNFLCNPNSDTNLPFSNLNVLSYPSILGDQDRTLRLIHWDRKASVWNTRKSQLDLRYHNEDVHTESIKILCDFTGISVDEKTLKELRKISKVLTFRVLFGEGIVNSTNKFKFSLTHGDQEAKKAYSMAQKFGLASTPEELIYNYYKAMEQLGYIDEFFKADATKDVTVFFTETAVYIFAMRWLWESYGIKTILKYDSFFMGVPEEYVDCIEEIMEQAITYGILKYKEWNLPIGHEEINCDAYLKVCYLKHLDEAKEHNNITHKDIKADLENWEDVISSTEAAKFLGVFDFNTTRENAHIAAATSNHAKRVAVMKSLVGKKGLTATEMSQKSQFKKKYPEEFKAIFG